MKVLTAACWSVFLCSSLPAQGYMTTPPGGLTTEGPEHAILMGGWSQIRIQHADDMHSDGKARAITEIAFRADYRAHTAKTAMGRTWTRITLDMSEPTNYASMSNVFAKNIGPSPTRVFDSKWSWPTQEGTPLLEPDVWGGARGQLRFPFVTPWRYRGKYSILADYVFRGGTLANNAAWTTLAKGPFYYLDSEIENAQARSTSQQLPRALPPCNDSAITAATGAYTYGYADVHSKKSPIVSLRTKVAFHHYSYYTAPNALVIHAVGAAGLKSGVNIGAGCNSLYVDFSKSVVLLGFRAAPVDGYSGVIQWRRTWQSQHANLDIWLQGAWSDSRSKRLMLTAATVVTLPNGLPPGYKTLFQPDIAMATGLGPNTTGLYFPYTRYSTR